MAVPGWPLPTFCTASAASSRVVSTARTSRSDQPAFFATGLGRPGSRPARGPSAFAFLVELGRVGFFADVAVLVTNGSPSPERWISRMPRA